LQSTEFNVQDLSLSKYINGNLMVKVDINNNN